jgi:hypothetical protein
VLTIRPRRSVLFIKKTLNYAYSCNHSHVTGTAYLYITPVFSETRHCFCLSDLPVASLTSVDAIRMHTPECLSVRLVLVPGLKLLIKLNSCSGRQLLPHTDIHKTCYPISRDWFSSYRMTQYYGNCPRVTENTSVCRALPEGHSLQTPGVDRIKL